jgi:hypothetical protein
MRLATLFVALFAAVQLVAACGSAGTSPSGGATPVASDAGPVVAAGPAYAQVGASSLLAINEIGVGENAYVSLTNFTDSPVGLKGLSLCQGKTCVDLPSDIIVPAGDTVRVSWGDGAGLDGVVMKNATLGPLAPTDGEIALYASPNRDDPKAIQTYIEWGSDPHVLTPVAIEAGLWMSGSFAPTSPNATRLWKADTGLWLFDE